MADQLGEDLALVHLNVHMRISGVSAIFTKQSGGNGVFLVQSQAIDGAFGSTYKSRHELRGVRRQPGACPARVVKRHTRGPLARGLLDHTLPHHPETRSCSGEKASWTRQ